MLGVWVKLQDLSAGLEENKSSRGIAVQGVIAYTCGIEPGLRAGTERLYIVLCSCRYFSALIINYHFSEH